MAPVSSDILIALSYYSIPLALIYLVRRRSDLAFNWMFGLFATFRYLPVEQLTYLTSGQFGMGLITSMDW